MRLKIIIFSAFFMLIALPASFAWRDADGYWGPNGYWHYYGSGRDQPYSYYIDEYYSPGFVHYPLVDPDFIAYVNTTAVPAVSPLAPQLQIPVAPPQQNEFTVNIPNDHGGYTPVLIKRSGNGYTGPQGEFYYTFPAVSQLKLMYGK
ncbi:MAG: hypothetical protein KGJ09_06720 [Candidatus Omnitrophica bacterium]|nr:hypothetical protein [Candidatus Omnitrophota bacterium]